MLVFLVKIPLNFFGIESVETKGWTKNGLLFFAFVTDKLSISDSPMSAAKVRPLLVYQQGTQGKEAVGPLVWDRLVESLVCSVFIEEAKFIEEWESQPDPRPALPQAINIE